MSIERKLGLRKERRTLRVRKKIKARGLPRISVFRSSNHIYGQLIDDVQGVTLASCSTLEIKTSGDKKTQAKAVGLELAKRALKKGVKQIAFDRGPYLYHGRIKELAEGLREGGLTV